MIDEPQVLFVCVRNAGKSQMAAGLLRELVGDAAVVASAGTEAGPALNDLSVRSLQEIGVDITGNRPRSLTDDMVVGSDVVVTLGREAHVARAKASVSRPGARTSRRSAASRAWSACA
ncbi:arsenate-mycothiol transferase ArsC [Blastococcus haudaquaticus]|uniref:Low molecular weight phosphotyrosine protein phosphatase n=1 Tax=Blastococcus haudaquaticus TaxID=1938745 RepID=A0A286GFX3_9ACTN|nr:hypothetical protein [Blastococcus haudaquaticus]SOD94390.1 Low molecular weight phosphotyrosine protein phosphatase [Blastococcus haudaquaticus]